MITFWVRADGRVRVRLMLRARFRVRVGLS